MSQSVKWAPLPDITLYELAIALGVLLQAAGGAKVDLVDAVGSLPANVQRHFWVG